MPASHRLGMPSRVAVGSQELQECDVMVLRGILVAQPQPQPFAP